MHFIHVNLAGYEFSPLGNFVFSFSVVCNKSSESGSAQLRNIFPSRSVILNVRVCGLWCKTHDPMTVILVELYTTKMACTGQSLLKLQS